MYTHPGDRQLSDDAALARRVSEADFQSITRARQTGIGWFSRFSLKLFRGKITK